MKIIIGKLYRLKKDSPNFYGEYILPIKFLGHMFVSIRRIDDFDREVFLNYEYILSNYLPYEHG